MKLQDQCVTPKGLRIGQVAPVLRQRARQVLLGRWQEGELQAPETVTNGLETAPHTLISLLDSGNTGKRIIRLPWEDTS